MNPEQIVDDFKSRTHVRREGNCYYLLMPLFHRYESASIPLCLEIEGDTLWISDCASTMEYLDNMEVDRTAHRPFIEKVKKRFGITEVKKGELRMEFPSDQIVSIERRMGFFIQAITLIANCDLAE